MGEDEKKDYRLHLINTIDNAIDNGISVYDLDVVNKKAIRHNYINKQKVIEAISVHQDYLLNQAVTSNPTLDACFRDRERYAIQILQELLEGERK